MRLELDVVDVFVGIRYEEALCRRWCFLENGFMGGDESGYEGRLVLG